MSKTPDSMMWRWTQAWAGAVGIGILFTIYLIEHGPNSMWAERWEMAWLPSMAGLLLGIVAHFHDAPRHPLSTVGGWVMAIFSFTTIGFIGLVDVMGAAEAAHMAGHSVPEWTQPQPLASPIVIDPA